MARPRFFKAKPSLQAAILAAATQEIARSGYEGASLNRILRAARLGKGSFYYYFDDKADLAATVLRKAYDDIVASTGGLTVARDAGDFWAAVGELQRQSIETVGQSRELREAVARIAVAAQQDAALAALLAPMMREASAASAQLWKRGQAMGAVRKDMDVRVIVALVQTVKETVIRVMLPAQRPVRPREAAKMAAVVLDMIRRVAEPGAAGRRLGGRRNPRGVRRR